VLSIEFAGRIPKTKTLKRPSFVELMLWLNTKPKTDSCLGIWLSRSSSDFDLKAMRSNLQSLRLCRRVVEEDIKHVQRSIDLGKDAKRLQSFYSLQI